MPPFSHSTKLKFKPNPQPRARYFDVFNSASTGHQVADGGSRGREWRITRHEKLARQFGSRDGDCTSSPAYHGYLVKGRDGDAGGDEDAGRGEWPWTTTTTTPISTGQMDIRNMLGGQVRKRVHAAAASDELSAIELKKAKLQSAATLSYKPSIQTTTEPVEQVIPSPKTLSPYSQNERTSKAIFTSLIIHINGQTTPLISDHALKRLLTTQGATLSLTLSRKITHVIIGVPNAGPGNGGAGGGLAATKIQKEIQRGGWKGVKVVTVQWVLDSIQAGKRLSEARYAVQLGGKQRSVLGFCSPSSTVVPPLSAKDYYDPHT
ncbi:uncharacterized protein BP01DRAFT_348048 [Aspergillus saccharolyticus JOP 1030-1]|uniref:BRCT domain-containing protein n=1 Tax=Aspergillus saccharolyticus JOP 1030-1 TaxID=1450539 RepID=A0A318ZP21_9EURO|nr:hypothetical protein BP01DRAFT_348048 [Aspergillus saccharolyticus JOP 1030-1]PYH41858.1 hypothetical protein BP01DRAFT_348048 [Aspergillus saccharolyticus JOP 1030-1]